MILNDILANSCQFFNSSEPNNKFCQQQPKNPKILKTCMRAVKMSARTLPTLPKLTILII